MSEAKNVAQTSDLGPAPRRSRRLKSRRGRENFQFEDTAAGGRQGKIFTLAACAASCGAIAICAFLPQSAVVVVAMVLVALFMPGWGHLVLAPAPQVTGRVVLVAGLAATAVSALTGRIDYVVVVAGLMVIGSFLGEMTRPERSALLRSVTASIAGAILVLPAGALVALGSNAVWRGALLPAAVVAFVATVCATAPRIWGKILPFILAPLTGAALAYFIIKAQLLQIGRVMFLQHSGIVSDSRAGLVIVLAILGVFAAALVVFSRQTIAEATPPRRWSAAITLGVMPVIMIGIPAFALSRIGG